MLEEAAVLRPALSLHPRASAPWRSRGCFQQQRARRGSVDIFRWLCYEVFFLQCMFKPFCLIYFCWRGGEQVFQLRAREKHCKSVTSVSALHTLSLLTRARCCISSTVSGITTTVPQVSILSTFSCLIPILVYPILKYVPQSLDTATGEKQAAVAWHGGELLTLKLAPNPKVL